MTELPKSPELRFDQAGKFRILQVADLHLSTGPGDCRDVPISRTIECSLLGADKYSLNWLETSLDELKPSLVVLTGDQLNGQETSWAAHSTMLKLTALLWKRGLPWVVVFGNHDGENDYDTNESQMELYRSMPGCLSERGPEGVDGIGNYVRGIRGYRENTTLFNLYFLDSHVSTPSASFEILTDVRIGCARRTHRNPDSTSSRIRDTISSNLRRSTGSNLSHPAPFRFFVPILLRPPTIDDQSVLEILNPTTFSRISTKMTELINRESV